MDANELLTELDRQGVTLTLTPSSLRYQGPPGAMTPPLRQALQEHKAEVRDLLRGGAARAPLSGETPETPRNSAGISPTDAQEGHTLDTGSRAPQGNACETDGLISQLEDHLAVMAAATGCDETTAEELLGEWERLVKPLGMFERVANLERGCDKMERWRVVHEGAHQGVLL